jgi:hypothetical protein
VLKNTGYSFAFASVTYTRTAWAAMVMETYTRQGPSLLCLVLTSCNFEKRKKFLPEKNREDKYAE